MRHTASVAAPAVWLLVLSTVPSYGKGKSACDLVPKAAIDAVLGAGFYLAGNVEQPGTQNVAATSSCDYREQLGPAMRTVRIYVTELVAPDPGSVEKDRQTLAAMQQGRPPQDVPGVGDAALWGNQLDVFIGGTTTVSITVSGRLPNPNDAREMAVKLAQKALGSPAKTGYVYGTAKSQTASAVAPTPVTPPAPAARTPQPAPPVSAASSVAPPGPKQAASQAAATPPGPVQTSSSVQTSAVQTPPVTIPANASAGLVRKSVGYWAAYQSDLIRKVFDGDYTYIDPGSSFATLDRVDRSQEFRLLFGRYVEFFSQNCQAYLPAERERMTFTPMTTSTDRYGVTTSAPRGPSSTMDVDARFAKIYRGYLTRDSTPLAGLKALMDVNAGKTTVNKLLSSGNDADKLIATAGCPSASVKQLGENLLRAAAGEKSLQDSGAGIQGAEAESDVKGPVALFSSDIQPLYLMPEFGYSSLRKDDRDLVMKQLSEFRQRNQQLLRCIYGDPKVWSVTYHFWHQSVLPDLRQMLISNPRHPFAVIHSVVRECPATPELAKQRDRANLLQ